MKNQRNRYAFQSTLPREERLVDYEKIFDVCIFQSTLPREERRIQDRRAEIFRDFNPRSHERSDRNWQETSSCMGYFNPRSHERSDWNIDIQATFSSISIHAPTRGATQVDQRSRCRITISIHAPTRGATLIVHICRSHMVFQSTLPREERRNYIPYV